MSRVQQELIATIFDKKGRVVSVGKNSYFKSHPLQYRFAKSAGRPDAIFLHAEIHALSKLKNNSHKAHSIKIERYGKNGEPLLAKPCEICEKALEEFGIKKIEYTC